MLASAALLKRVLPSYGDEESDEVALVAILDGVELEEPLAARSEAGRCSRGSAASRSICAKSNSPPDAHLDRALGFRRHRASACRLGWRVESNVKALGGGVAIGVAEPETADAPTLTPRRLHGVRRRSRRREGTTRPRARCAGRRGTSSRSPSASFALSRPRSAGRFTRRPSSSCRGSCANHGSTRRPPRTCSGSRSSSWAASTASARGRRRRGREFAEEARRPQDRRERHRARLDPRVRLLTALAPGRRRGRHARNARLPRRTRRRAEGGGRPRDGRGVRVGRRPAGRARRSKRDDGAAHRHPAARGRGPQALARGPARRREEPADAAGARRRLPGTARGGRPGAAVAARGLARHGPRVLQLGAQGRPPARARPVHGGSAPDPRRGIRARTRGASGRRTRRLSSRHFDPRQATLTERGLRAAGPPQAA